MQESGKGREAAPKADLEPTGRFPRPSPPIHLFEEWPLDTYDWILGVIDGSLESCALIAAPLMP